MPQHNLRISLKQSLSRQSKGEIALHFKRGWPVWVSLSFCLCKMNTQRQKMLHLKMWRRNLPATRNIMEYLDIVDEHGNPTGDTVERAKAHAEGIMHRTSHVWLVRRKEGHLQILLQKRCDTKDSFPGCYDISSAGHIPAGVGFAQSAVRELKEELGIDATEQDLVFCGDRMVIWDEDFNGRPFHDRQYSRVFALWCGLDEDAFTLQKEEVSEVRWMDIDELIESVRLCSIPNCINTDELLMVRNAAKAF